MQIAILGGTKLGQALGDKFAARGIQVTFGVRNDFESNQIEWKILKMSPGKVGTFEEAIAKGEVILICCENIYLNQICDCLGAMDLTNKIIVDCTNSNYPDNFSSNTNVIEEFVGKEHLIKAFNNLGVDYPASDPMGIIKEVYYCGEEGYKKSLVKRIICQIGFKAIDSGKLGNAILLEAFYHLRKEISQKEEERSEMHFKLISV